MAKRTAMAKRNPPGHSPEAKPSRGANPPEPSQEPPPSEIIYSRGIMRHSSEAEPSRKQAPVETIVIIEPKAYRGARTILSLKGRDDWSAWLTELAKHCRTDRVGVLDRAAAELAERVGFRRPPPRL